VVGAWNGRTTGPGTGAEYVITDTGERPVADDRPDSADDRPDSADDRPDSADHPAGVPGEALTGPMATADSNPAATAEMRRISRAWPLGPWIGTGCGRTPYVVHRCG
jgi:hypothetical protein